MKEETKIPRCRVCGTVWYPSDRCLYCKEKGLTEPIKKKTLMDKLWNKDAERGVVWGLIASMVILPLIGSSDTSLLLDYHFNDLPYGQLFAWLNPWYWTQTLYMVTNTLIITPFFLLQYYYYRKGRIPKMFVLMNLFCTVFFSATHVWQENTTIVMGPLIIINPAFAIPMILQKLPLWYPWNSGSWTCGIHGVCQGFGVLNSRLDIARSDFFTHLTLIFWVIAPLLYWYKRKYGHLPFQRGFNWANKHWKILFIIWLAFMFGITIYAAWHNHGFWTYCGNTSPTQTC